MLKQTLFLFGSAAFAASPTVFDKVVAGDPDPEAQVIQYNPRITPTCEAMLRYNTTFIIEKTKNGQQEKIIDVAVGDSGIWRAGKSTMGDAAYLHPDMVGLKTNIDISTDHGNHYSCLVQDQSGIKGAHPHLKVIFVPVDADQVANTEKERQYVSIEEFKAVQNAAKNYQQQAETAVAQAKQEVQTVKVTAKTEALAGLIRDYNVPDKAKQAPFFVTEVARDDHHTFIFVDAHAVNTGAEVGAVYELMDKNKNTFGPVYDDKLHAYVTPHAVPGALVLKVGKKEVAFTRTSR